MPGRRKSVSSPHIPRAGKNKQVRTYESVKHAVVLLHANNWNRSTEVKHFFLEKPKTSEKK